MKSVKHKIPPGYTGGQYGGCGWWYHAYKGCRKSCCPAIEAIITSRHNRIEILETIGKIVDPITRSTFNAVVEETRA